MPSNYALNNFVAGEFSPRLSTRIDIEKYKSSCYELTNMSVWSHGGAWKRPGTEYIATVGDTSNNVRLIPFINSETVAYALEFGDEYIRFFKDKAQVATVSGVPYQITSPYTSEQLSEIKYTQIADVMYLVHPDVHPQKLTRYANNSWTIEDIPFYDGPFLDKNDDETIFITISGTDLLEGTLVTVTASGSNIFNSNHVGALWKIEGTVTESSVINTANTWTESVPIGNNETFQFNILGTFVADIKLQRSIDNGENWTDFATYDDNIQAQITESIEDAWYRAGIATGGYTSGSATLQIVKLNQCGYVQIYNYVSTTQVQAEIISDLPTAGPTYEWYEGAFSPSNGYPCAIAIFKQRLILSGCAGLPNYIWGSVIDDYENFDIGVGNADDSFMYKPDSGQLNIIKSLRPFKDSLHIFSNGSCSRFYYNSGEANIDEEFASTGNNYVQSINVGTSTLHVQKDGKVIWKKYYNGDTYAYEDINITEIAEHMFRNTTINDIVYANEPDTMLYVLKDDNTMSVCKLDMSQGVIAYSDYVTDGYFESACVIPGQIEDEVWLSAVRENEDGQTRFIEVLSSSRWADVSEANYLDSMLTYSGTATTDIYGLDHLKGCTVGVTWSGTYIGDYEVNTNGHLTLDDPYTGLKIGLKYDVALETMPIEMPAQLGNSQNKNKIITAVSIRFMDTLGGYLGYDTSNMKPISSITSGQTMYGETRPLFTGYKRLQFPKGYDRDIKVRYENEDPVPVHIITIIPEISVG